MPNNNDGSFWGDDAMWGEYFQNDSNSEANIWSNYSFSNFDEGFGTQYINMFQSAGKMIFYANGLTYDDYSKQWIQYGNNFTNKMNNYWDNVFDIQLQAVSTNSFEEFINSLGSNIAEIWNETIANGNMWGRIGDSSLLLLESSLSAVVMSASQGINLALTSGPLIDMVNGVESKMSGIFAGTLKMGEAFGETMNQISNTLSNTGSTFLNILGKGIDIFTSGGLKQYVNGVEETSFGRLMESSWNKNANSFLKLVNGTTNYKVKINKTTPFDSGANMMNIYGKMMLGAPPLFNNITDPKNRSIANTFLRDARFLTLTPGFPKYNGSSYLMTAKNDQYHQTATADSMIAYLLKNGLDSEFASKDRRYYTFKADYDEYYSYLETMLNTVWTKMGLGKESSNTYNLFSFFDIVDDSGNLTNGSKLKPQYNTSLGFYVNPSGVLTENISNSPTSFSLASQVNSASDEYQQINFLTGMGTGGAMRQGAAVMAKTAQLTNQMLNFVSTAAERTVTNIKSGSGPILTLLKAIPAGIADVRNFLTNQDNGAVMQSFATTNGMKVVYPELWADATYTKSININFEFVSPYGDPLSIFNYVLAPFFALLCFAMPRQAADNGFVSPFFVRADIPGLFTSDLSLITDFTWTKGGDNNLWTKDGLPRAISGSFMLADLYPFLAMTKRLSFLSANPNYTVFLDNLAGLHAVDTGNSDDALNEYYKTLLNRVSGEVKMTSLWNNYSQKDSLKHATYANKTSSNRLGGNTKKYTSSSWLRGLK